MIIFKTDKSEPDPLVVVVGGGGGDFREKINKNEK